MNIIVCCKQVIDPEAPLSSYKVDIKNNIVTLPYNIHPVLNPFDENAVEAALQVKEKYGGKIIILSLGNNLERDVIRKPLAMGADELILLEDEAFEYSDSWSTAHALVAAIKKIGDYDLIFCGRQAADWDSGQVGLGIAELLNIPSITLARKIINADRTICVERIIDNGYQVVEVKLPALITVGSEIGQPRYPTIRGIKEAAKKPQTILKPSDIGLESSPIGYKGRIVNIINLYQPIIESKCEIIDGENQAESGIILADKLREANII